MAKKPKLKIKAGAAGRSDFSTARSEGHVAFVGTRKIKVGKETQTVHGRIDESDDPVPGDVEYFVGPSGLSVYKARASSPIRAVLLPHEEKFGERKVRCEFSTMNLSGVDAISDWCRTNHFYVPEETKARKRRYEQMTLNAASSSARAIARRRMESGLEQDDNGGSGLNGGRKMKNRTTDGRTLAEAWVDAFKKNEQDAKVGKAKTDAQLVAHMRSLFPQKKGVKSIEKIERQRHLYNEGIRRFKKFGPAKPKSHRYEDGKTPLGPSGRGGKKKEAKKAVAQNKPAKVQKQKAKPAAKKPRLVIKKSKPAPASAPAASATARQQDTAK